MYAASRSENSLLDSSARFEVVNVNSHSLGIAGVDAKTRQPFNKIIIPRNTPLPVTKTQTFVTKRDDQPNVRVQLVEGESENPKFCSPVAKCVVHLDPPVPEGTIVEVSCCYEADGTIRTAESVVSRRSQGAMFASARKLDTQMAMQTFEMAGFENLRLDVIEDMGHELPPAEAMANAIAFVNRR